MRWSRRLLSPAGLVLAGLCLLLPFLSASCASEGPPRVQWRVTYTGADIVAGGRPDVAFTGDADREPIHDLDGGEMKRVLGGPPAALPAQPVAWLAAALMVAALAATALRSRAWRTSLTGGLALAAAVVLWGAAVLARRDAVDAVTAVLSQVTGSRPPDERAGDTYEQVRALFHFTYGLWLALSVLATVGVASTVAAVGRGRGG
ncbi:hypothetical protein JIG36_09770 [Actinoplanes sp. LDG1-06]|uniref:Uncharacterized protein n=1 Tax=Paractinoplanes ovalisporus TaxID=2810368 RepID=A0ABS2A7R7_9ACTN|nr:hypothetical protein [Actinoplanes ovalisporus]MBM2615842.1 hypothetical protein [Actinoplanes ovalisporus]